MRGCNHILPLLTAVCSLFVINAPDIPVELYPNIFQYSSTQDLASLARVSQTFQHAAESSLYFSVDFTTVSNDCQRIMSWCTTVTKDERRALRVNTLKFPSDFQTPSTFDIGLDIQQTLTQAFNAIVNLKHIFFLQKGRTHQASLYPSTLIGCTFRLKSFAGQANSFTSQDIWGFLARQQEVEYWVPTRHLLESVVEFPANVLPRLRETILVVPSKTRYLQCRPVEILKLVSVTLHFTMTDGLAAITPL